MNSRSIRLGAQDFIKSLIDLGHEVIIVTACYDPIHASCTERLLKDFPELTKITLYTRVEKI